MEKASTTNILKCSNAGSNISEHIKMLSFLFKKLSTTVHIPRDFKRYYYSVAILVEFYRYAYLHIAMHNIKTRNF